MGLYIGETQINGIELLLTWNKSLLGCVNNIRFSIVDNTLYVKWLDPDDSYQEGMLVSKFAGTKLLMKTTGYPEDETDGTLIVNNTVKNLYNDTALTATLPTYDDETEYYFRFFSYDDNGNYNGETQLSYQNRFSSESYSWDQVVENLHNYPEDSELVPLPGTIVNLKYLINDYYTLDGGVKVACDTRQKVYDARNKMESVSIPWVILGHNANVPLYINYRRKVDNVWENIFVQSIDDHTTDYTIFDKDGSSTISAIETGDGFFRNIGPGCRTYSESWDLTANIHTYTDRNDPVTAIGDTTFSYANEGVGKLNEYSVPKQITVGGNVYDFCGYTMTMMPVNCLAGSSTTTFYNYIQFDAPEQLTASAYKLYPSTASSTEKYYFLSSDGYHEIDYKSQSLYGQHIGPYVVDSVSCDVYLNIENLMNLATAKYRAGWTYFKLSSDELTQIILTAGTDYTIGDTIPLNPHIYVKNDTSRNSSGSNLYSESSFRQYVNNKNGSGDANYLKLNIFDVVSTTGMMNLNGPLLKLFLELQFISHLKIACSMVVISNNYQHYCRTYKTTGSTKYELCKDLFWALGYYETFGTGVDGTATFNAVFTNNDSRIKKVLTASGVEGSASSWWLKYPNTGNTHNEYNVTTSGASTNYYASNSTGCSPACLIG